MKRIVLIAVAFASSVAAARTISDNKKTLSHDCGKDPVVVVSGNDNTLTITGKCTTVTVAGNGNKVTSDTVEGVVVSGNKNDVRVTAADRLMLSGNDNDASYSKGMTKDKPTVTNSGKNNRVIKEIVQPSK
jgi:Protein of unknown function (DUF3060)